VSRSNFGGHVDQGIAGGGDSLENPLGGLGVFLGVMFYRRWQ
jgi:hypothetical protein